MSRVACQARDWRQYAKERALHQQRGRAKDDHVAEFTTRKGLLQSNPTAEVTSLGLVILAK
jgi:hypothetical protein